MLNNARTRSIPRRTIIPNLSSRFMAMSITSS